MIPPAPARVRTDRKALADLLHRWLKSAPHPSDVSLRADTAAAVVAATHGLRDSAESVWLSPAFLPAEVTDALRPTHQVRIVTLRLEQIEHDTGNIIAAGERCRVDRWVEPGRGWQTAYTSAESCTRRLAGGEGA